MSSRREFIALQVAATLIGFTIALGGGFSIDRAFSHSSVRSLADSAAAGIGATVSQVLTGGHTSYRKYLAASRGPTLPPSRFWATTGQMVVSGVGLVTLVTVTVTAVRAPEGTTVRTIAGLSWIAIPGALLVYALVARDWRPDLRSRRDAF